MSMEISESEFLEFQSVIRDVNDLCITMWQSVFPTALLGKGFQFHDTREIEKSRIWTMACAAWMELTECHLDPQQMVYACQDYLNSSRNADPAQDFKASL